MMTQLSIMHGLHNTFAVLEGPVKLSTYTINNICSSAHEVILDGLIVVSAINKHSFKMAYWNNDGSEAEMCGNGLRCALKFAVDKSIIEAGVAVAQTKAGPLDVLWDGKSENLEIQVGKVKASTEPVTLQNTLLYTATVGNPHAITFVANVNDAPVRSVGPLIEKDIMFPNRTNVEFVEVKDDHKISLRVWERGVGETQACGTGMVASAGLAVGLGKCRYPVSIEVQGGVGHVWVDELGYSRLKAPAVLVDTLQLEL